MGNGIKRETILMATNPSSNPIILPTVHTPLFSTISIRDTRNKNNI